MVRHMSRLFALFVGIDKYTAVTPLTGCVEDVAAIETLFRSRVDATSLELTILRDEEATRDGIINGFRSHLAQARTGDFALFYFCGHGSQEPCPPEWLHLEPSGQNQTIVPVDARTSDVFEIADKELSALIAHVASSGARVVTVFDSCHSGGVTRGIEEKPASSGVARTTPARSDRVRTFDDYLDLARELYHPERLAAEGAPQPPHIAIAACQQHETAKEFPLGPPKTGSRGAFSLSFEGAIRALGPTATYVDVVTAIRMKVRGTAEDQVPNLEVFGAGLETEMFLGGQAGRRDLTVDASADGRWWLSAGTIDGIPSTNEGTATVAIFERGASSAPGATPVAIATVVSAETDRSEVKLAGSAALDAHRQYLAVVSSFGAPPSLYVVIDGTAAPDLATAIRARLQTEANGRWAVTDRAGRAPAVVTTVSETEVRLAGIEPVVDVRFTSDEAGVGRLIETCIHLARWYGLRDRRPPGSPLNDTVRIEVVSTSPERAVVPDNRPALPVDEAGAVVVSYANSQPPSAQIRIRNTSDDRLYVVLLDLTDSFGCSTIFADWIPSKGVGFVDAGRAVNLRIALWRDSADRATDDFKVFAALEDFDATRFKLTPLLGPKATSMRSVQRDEEVVSWGTSHLHLEIRR
jgi:Caspase domain